MRISNHRLSGDQVRFEASQNHGGGFAEGAPDAIVVHYTAGGSLESSVRTLCDPGVKASAHVVVGRLGEVVQLVPFDTVSWHAGRSRYRGRRGYNRFSIGVEIDNAGRLERSGGAFASWFGRTYPASEVVEATHRNQSAPAFWHRYSEEQIERVFALCGLLAETYPIREIVGHEEIAPDRKTDPGPAFPLERLRGRILLRDRFDEEGEPPDAPDPAGRRVGMVTAERLNVRAGPGVDAGKVGPPLAGGTVLHILSEREGWLEIEQKVHGWVKAEYVRT